MTDIRVNIDKSFEVVLFELMNKYATKYPGIDTINEIIVALSKVKNSLL